MWAEVPAINGEPCMVRVGEQAHRIAAPVALTAFGLPDADGDRPDPQVRIVPVFDETQLVSPSARTPRRAVLTDQDLTAALGVVQRFESSVGIDALSTAGAVASRVETNAAMRVISQRLGIHPGRPPEAAAPEWMTDPARLRASVKRVLAAVDEIIDALEQNLGVDLTSDIFQPLRSETIVVRLPQPRDVRPVVVGIGRGVPAHPDDVVAQHLAAGDLDWRRLARELPGADTDRFLSVSDHPAERAIALAEAGVSPDAIADVLVAADVPFPEIVSALLIETIDADGERGPLFADDELVTVLPSLGVDVARAQTLRHESPAPAIEQQTLRAVAAAEAQPVRIAADPRIAAWTSIPTRDRVERPADGLITYWTKLAAPPVADLGGQVTSLGLWQGAR
jgi:hypothetical protein